METVTATRPFQSAPPDTPERCRSLESRMSWPSATAQSETGATHHHEVAMRRRPASLTDITVAEELEPEDERPDGVLFATAQRVTWPDDTAKARTEYRSSIGRCGG